MTFEEDAETMAGASGNGDGKLNDSAATTSANSTSMTVPPVEPPLVGDVPMVGEKRLMQVKEKQRDKTRSMMLDHANQRVAAMALCLLAVVIGTGVGLGIGLQTDNPPESGSTPETGPGSTGTSPVVPTPGPTFNPTPDPTGFPVTVATLTPAELSRLDDCIEYIRDSNVTGETVLRQSRSPQNQAIQFMARGSLTIPTNSDEAYRFIERYALATFYYSTIDGPFPWDFRYNFINQDYTTCDWNDEDLEGVSRLGAFCDGGLGKVTRIQLRKWHRQ